MIDFAATQKELERLAVTLAKNGDIISAARIRQLIIAVGGDPSAEDWAATNIQSVIDPEAIAGGLKSRSVAAPWIGFLEWLRNGLVLFPLILTWFGISEASQKYQALINSDRSQELHSFLYLWQQGFNHTLPAPFILSNLALADCILLTTIFVLTLVATWQYSLFTAQNEKRAEQLRTSLSHALGDTALCLSMIHRQRQLNQPSNLNDIAKYLYQFGEQFKQTTQQFLKEMTEERKQRGDLSTFTAALDGISKDMLKAAVSMQQTNASLTTTLQEILVPVREIPKLVLAAEQAVTELNKMTGSLGQLVGDQARWRQELQTVLASGLNQLIAEQKQATQDLRAMLEPALRHMNTSLGQLIAEQKQAAQDLRIMLNALLTQQTAEQARIGQELYTMMSSSFSQLLAEQQKLGQELVSAAKDLETGTLALGGVVQALGKSTADQTQVLASMQGLQGEQRRLTSEMAATTEEIKKVLKATHESVPELRSMAVDMNRFAQALRDIPVALNTDLLAPLQHYSSAAAKINTGADTLGRASQYLESVTSKLDGRIGP